VRRDLLLSFVFASSSLFATAARAEPGIVVHGEADCPSVEMIRAAMQALRPDGTWPAQEVTVDVSEGRMSLAMGDDSAARRELPAASDCPTRAETVAFVMRAWADELPSHPADSPVFTVAVSAPALASPKRPSHVIELDGEAFYSPVWGHAPGAAICVGRTPRDGGLGVRLLGAYQSAHDVAIEGGTNQLMRLLVGAAATLHLQGSRVFASGDVGMVGSLTRAMGSGYVVNQAAATLNFGGLADVRAGLRFGRYRLWSNARLLRLFQGETVKVASSSPGIADSSALAAWDVQLGLGFGVRFE
jgi:hypothetical protein